MTSKTSEPAPVVTREQDSGRILKRSLSIAGHRTSVSLEAAFWARLREIAESRSVSLAALVAEIDENRSASNLSSAIRVYVLEAALNNGLTPPDR